jgi:hypothetical protein
MPARKYFKIFIFLFLLNIPVFGLAYTSNDYYQAGLTLYQQKDFTKAIQYFKAAVQIDPLNWQAYQVLGNTYYQTGDNADALEAFDKSLQSHPDNPSLKTFADSLRAKAAVNSNPVTAANAPPPGSEVSPAAASSAPRAPMEIPLVFEKGRWANFHLGAMVASLGDMPAGADAIKKNFSSIGATASADGLGLLLGGEGGYSFDRENAVGASVEIGIFGGYKDGVSNGFNNGSDSFTPLMGDFAVKYYHFFPMGASRLRLEGGPGLYFTSLQVEQISNGVVQVSGPMSGLGFGGTLGAGWSFDVGGVAIDFFAHGRFASTSNIQGDFQDPSGNTYKLGLIMDKNNLLATQNTSFIGTNGTRWANVDYTGADAGIGIVYRY